MHPAVDMVPEKGFVHRQMILPVRGLYQAPVKAVGEIEGRQPPDLSGAVILFKAALFAVAEHLDIVFGIKEPKHAAACQR